MKTIIIDTNALMAMDEFGLDIFSAIREACNFPYTLAVLSKTMEELQSIMNSQRLKYKKAAKLALEMIKKKKLTVIESKGDVDDDLVEYSQKGYLILTQDHELKKRLKKPYLTIRQKSKIIILE